MRGTRFAHIASGQYSVFRLRKYKRCHIAAAGQWLVPARSRGPALYSDEAADVSPAHSNTRTHHSKLELTLGLLTRWHYQDPEEDLVLVFCCPAAALGFIQHQSSCILATCPLPGVGGTQKFIINIFVPKNASNCNKFDIILMYLTGCNIYFYDI